MIINGAIIILQKLDPSSLSQIEILLSKNVFYIFVVGKDLENFFILVPSLYLQCMNNSQQLRIMYWMIYFVRSQLSWYVSYNFPICINTLPSPIFEASVHTIKPPFPDSSARIGLVVSLFFNSSKLCWHCGYRINGTFFFSKFVNGIVTIENSLTNLW